MAKRHKRNQNRKPTLRFRVNEQIRIPEIRLVGDNMKAVSEAVGQNIESGIYPTRKVQEWARKMDLDLVEISPKARPPVCQIIDYKKFLYMRKKKEKEIKAKAVKTVVKEIRFGPNISEHDFDFKLKHAVNFLQEGAKVKAYVHFRGRTIVFRDRGELVLLRFIKELEAYGSPEALPKMEGRRMIVVIAPKKSAIKKKAKSAEDKQRNKRKSKEKKADDATTENTETSTKE
ncbi:MAG: translation initiation factor IF-3 [Bacteroidota bacterium]